MGHSPRAERATAEWPRPAAIPPAGYLPVWSRAMPASDIQQGRPALRLAPALFWCGIAVAPIAAFLLLIAHSAGPVRLSAALAVLAVILIGLSMVLRRDPEAVRDEIEHILLDEVDGLRDDFADE